MPHNPASKPSGGRAIRLSTASLLAASMLMPTAATAQTQSTWLNAADGDWDDPANWSTAVFPNNGQPTTGDTYNVLIDAAGSPYFIRLDNSMPQITADTIMLDSPDATLFLKNNIFGLTTTNALIVNQGRLLLDAARLDNTTISGTDGTIEVLQGNNPGYFNNVTLGLDMTISQNERLFVYDSVTLDQSTLFLNGGFNSALVVGAGESSTSATDLNLLGTGDIIMTGQSQLLAGLVNTLKIDSEINIMVDNRAGRADARLAGARVENNGLITVDGDFSYLDIEAAQFTNNGTIHATKQGEVDIQFDNAVAVSSSQLTGLQTSNGGRIFIRGAIDNTGQTLALGGPSGGDFSIVGYGSNYQTDYSRIIGGRIETPESMPLNVIRTELEGVTIAGEVAGSRMWITSGLTMDGGKLAGSEFMWFDGGITVSGTGVIESVYTGSGTLDGMRIGYPNSGPVEFGQNITFHSKNTSGRYIGVNQFINKGTILIDESQPGVGYGGGIRGNMVNQGTIRVLANSELIGDGIANPIVNSGLIEVTTGRTLQIKDGFENAGNITLRSGSQLLYINNYNLNAFGSITNEGGIVELRGDLQLQGQVFDVDVLLGIQPNLVELKNNFIDGTITRSSGELLDFAGGSRRLTDITLDTDATLYSVEQLWIDGDLVINEGKTLYLGKIPVGITDTPRATIRAHGGGGVDKIVGPGEIVVTGASSNPSDITLQGISTTPLTLGPGLTVRTDGGSFRFSAINQGLIQVNNPGDIVEMYDRLNDESRNEGTIEVNAGEFRIGEAIDIDKLGTLIATPEASITVTGQFDLLDGTLDPASYGGQWRMRGGTIANGRIETSGTPILVDLDTHVGGLGGALENVTLAGQVNVGNNSELKLTDGLVFDNGSIFIGDDARARVSTNGNSVALTGNGEIVFTGTAAGNRLTLRSGTGSDNFTIGPGVIIRTDGNSGEILHSALSITNSGLISADENSIQILTQNTSQTFLNPNGILEAKNGGFLRVVGMSGDIGTLSIVDGGTIRFGVDDGSPTPHDGDYRISEAFTLDSNEELQFFGITELGSNLTISSDGRVIIGNTWTNTGTVNLQSGGVLEIDRLPDANGTLNLDGTVVLNGLFTTPDLLTLPLGSAEVVVSTSGTIHNALDTLTIGSDVAALGLRGGRIEGGTIASATSEKLTINYNGGSSQLVGVQDIQSEVDLIDGDLVIDSSTWTGQINTSANTHLFLQGIGWDNTGGVTATDAQVTLAGSSANLGSIGLTRSTLNVTNANTVSALQAAVAGTDSEIRIASGGSVDNIGNTIVLDENILIWSLAGGTLTGGQVQVTSSESFHAAGGSIDGVVFTAPVEISGPGNVELSNASQLSGGLIYTNPSGTALVNLGTGQTLSGFGDVLFDQGSTSSNRLQTSLPTLEILSGMTVRSENGGQGTLGATSANTINQGTLAADGAGSYLFATGSALTNNGLFSATNNGTLELDNFSGNLGQVVINTGGTLIVNGTYTIDQPLAIDGGSLELDGDWSAAANVNVTGGTLVWKSLPTSGEEFFQFSNSTFSIGTSMLPADLPVLIGGNNLIDVSSGGSFDLLGGGYDTDAVPLSLSGGTISNGQIDGSSSNPIQITSTSTFDSIDFNAFANITQASTLQVNTAIVNNGQIMNSGGTLSSSGFFTNTSSATVSGYGNFNFYSQILNQGALQFSGGDSIIEGNFTNEAGASVSTTGGHITSFYDDFTNQFGADLFTSAGSTTVFFDRVQGGGSFTGEGQVVFHRGLMPGSSPGTVTFEGDVQFLDTFSNRLFIELAGVETDQYDRLVIDGDLDLGGLLFVWAIDGFQPDYGQEFLIADVGGERTGEFLFLGQGDRVGVFNGIELFIDYMAGDGNDVALYTLLLGDGDGDGDVDLSDVTAVRQNFGSTGQAGGLLLGDADFDGDVDAFDLTAVEQNFGNTAQSSSANTATAIPEPTSLTLLAMTGLMMIHRRRRAA